MFLKALPKLFVCLLIAVLLVPMAQACTAFVVYRNGLALAGNNEDFWLTDTKIWFVPKQGSQRGLSGNHGRVYFGFDNFYPQGGMNDAGLFFDGFATAKNTVKNSADKLNFQGNLADRVMANCSTVVEVIAEFKKYNLSFLGNAMLMFGDQHGDSVIIEGDEMIRISGDHQIVTNFYQSQTKPGKCPCARFEAATKILAKGDPTSVEACRDILAATRQNASAPTQYSNVYDLKKGLIYLYHFHNFDKVVVLNLADELKKGAHEIDLPSLFPPHQPFDEFKKQRKIDTQNQIKKRTNQDISPQTHGDFTGKFAFDVGQAVKPQGQFLVKGDRLFVKQSQSPEQEIFPERQDVFFRIGDFGAETFHFQRNEKGNVSSVTFNVFGRSIRGTKLE